MVIEYNPTITGGFVFHVMRDRERGTEVEEKLNKLNLTEQEKHNLVKSILIAGFRDIKIDVNKKIKHSVEKAFEAADE